jgi:tRNA-2-methylthio-N6-dimethylallyladenosine synthase
MHHAFNEDAIGKTMEVLFEKPGRTAGQFIGRTPYLHPVHIERDDALIGQSLPVRIKTRMANSLRGERI